MTPTQTSSVAPAGVSTPVMFFLAAAACAVWVGVYFVRLKSEPPWLKWVRPPIRAAVGFGAMMMLGAAALRVVLLATDWPLWTIAALGAVCVEAVMGLYALERRMISRRVSLVLAALRIALVLAVVAMLTQPTWSAKFAQSDRATVAVLLDNSASMHVPQTQLNAAEKARLASAFSPARRPYRLDVLARQLADLHEELAVRRQWLAKLESEPDDARGLQLASHHRRMNKELSEWVEKLEPHLKELTAPPDAGLKLAPRTLNRLADVRTTLAVKIHRRLTEAVKLTEAGNAKRLAKSYPRLAAAVRDAAAAAAGLDDKLPALGAALDTAFYKSLPAAKRKELDARAARTRFSLARDVLLHRAERESGSGTAASLIERLGDDFNVSLYIFAAETAEVDVKEFIEEKVLVPTAPPAAAPAKLPDDQQQTDLAGALAKMLRQSEETNLAGVIVVSDVRHTGSGRPESYARDLGLADVPVCPIVIGSDQPPCDAAIVSLDAPEVITPKDKLYVDARIKLDGLAGRQVKVVLLDGEQEVDEQTVSVPNVPRLRKRLQLSHEPGEVGLHSYRLRIEPVEGEVVPDNNEHVFSVNVRDDQTKVLIVEGRPRWEYRYLKNLFATRDKSVRLQHVLLHPDEVTGQPRRRVIHASAMRPRGQPEATALPADKAEWLKFDVIVIGDLPPDALGAEGVEALRSFVIDKAGTLVCIAGPGYMPHAYGGTALPDLLPVRLGGAANAGTEIATAQVRRTGYRIALTVEGRDSIIMRLRVDPEENREVWQSVPRLFWRHPIAAAKPGASVLAYARTFDAPVMAEGLEGAQRTEQLERIRRYQRSRALISLHTVARGKVMFLSFDRTWRMRYRVGDTYHHKFWGQVLRWATADRLRSGTALVKLGTTSSRYGPNSPVEVRAHIVHEDFSPLRSDEVSVHVFRDDRLVGRYKLRHDKGSPGDYLANLGKLEGGAYRAVVHGAEVDEILRREGAVEKVEAEFSVDPDVPAEQVELAADPGLAGKLARISGGVMVDATQADRVLAVLSAGIQRREMPAQISLWDRWWLLLAMLALVTGEWLIRKKAGLV